MFYVLAIRLFLKSGTIPNFDLFGEIRTQAVYLCSKKKNLISPS